jgi:hypothetical protein
VTGAGIYNVNCDMEYLGRGYLFLFVSIVVIFFEYMYVYKFCFLIVVGAILGWYMCSA